VWCRDKTFKISYSILFNIARCRDAWVADLMLYRNGSIHWNISFAFSSFSNFLNLGSSFSTDKGVLLYTSRV